MEQLEFRNKIIGCLDPLLEKEKAFFIDLKVRQERGGKHLQIFVDTDSGITIEQCADISRELGRSLALAGLTDEVSGLEVSSPGIDKPLRVMRQYPKNIGRLFRIRFKAGEDQKTIEGKLSGVEGDRITVESLTGELHTISFADILETREQLPW